MDFSDLNIGKTIFESVPDAVKPLWAGRILSLFDQHLEHIPSQVNALHTIIKQPSSWQKAHDLFTEIRVFLLANPDFKPNYYLELAEKVAKITYNASGEAAPFDADSGWYIPQLALLLTHALGGEKLVSDVNVLLKLYIDKPYLKRRRNLQAAKELLFKLRYTP